MSDSDEKSESGEPAEHAVDFSTFMLSLAHSALVHLGDAADPTGATSTPDLVVAKQTIDLIALLSEKSKGNLSAEEERLVERLLSDLRSRYASVKTAK